MTATSSICGFRRLLATLVAISGLALVFAGMAVAGNGNGCNAPGHHYGLDCEDAAPPPPPPPAEPAPAAPPAEAPPAETPATPETAPPAAPVPEAAPPAETPPPSEAPASPPENAAVPPPSPPPAPVPTPAAPAAPPAVIDGWGPVGTPEPPARPTARRAASPRAAAATPPPAASWSNRHVDASWTDAQLAQHGVIGTGALVTIRSGHGIFGGLSFRIQLAPGGDTFVFRAARSVVAGSGGRLYRIGSWLRTDSPGLTVCLRIQEVTERDPLMAVRTSESCLSPTAKWRHFELYRRTLARGNKLVFSIYSFGAVAGDSFEVDGFTVHRRVGNRAWKRVDAAFSDPA